MVAAIHSQYIRLFPELSEEERRISGGKGGTLSRLFKKGYPVPEGLIILPVAFMDNEITDEAWHQVKFSLGDLRRKNPGTNFAIRSSAAGEDSASASFAGAFETVLNVNSDDEIRSAINSVRKSCCNERVMTYSKTRGISLIPQMAVVVQYFIPAEISGVLFTADPITGNRIQMKGNYVHGLNDKLVSGESEAMEFTIERSKYKYHGPMELERLARKLYRLASAIEKDLGSPQDIEWAVAGGRVYILQSRPITTLNGWDPVTGETNDTHTGDYVWSAVNIGEAMSVVLTPFSSSLMKRSLEYLNVVPGHALAGVIGGRLYQNGTVMVTLINALHQNFKDMSTELGGVSDEYREKMSQYLVPLRVSRFSILLNSTKMMLKIGQSLKGLPHFVESNPDQCRKIQQRIRSIDNINELLSLYYREIWPRGIESTWVSFASASRYGRLLAPLRRKLSEMVGARDADILLSNVSEDGSLLESLGPLAGLEMVAKGKMPREEYLARWGHRGALEGELSAPRPAESPEWLERQLDEYIRSGSDIAAMLEAKKIEFLATWERFRNRYPRLEKGMRRKLEKAADAARDREAVRSETTRVLAVVRSWVIRAGEITGIGDDVFFLTFQELFDCMSGHDAPLAYIPARRLTFERYKALPPYPLVIRGRFEPFQWANDPNRNNSSFDSHGLLPQLYPEHNISNVISGVAGASGKVEGIVRRLDSPEDGSDMKKGEVLVTSQTNIGWTLLFPKAAAIVTDVGAPLSHAAIVARELGIPAVLNCGNATTRLNTGDRVRVDGTLGIVEIL